MPFHIRAKPGSIAKYVLVPGDQMRARKIAHHFENAQLVDESRGYVIFSGQYQGIAMTVCATGMGGPAVAIAIEELAQLGADTFIRVGSCGALQPGIAPGDVIVATGVVRLGGAGNAYLPAEIPAVPSYSVMRAMDDAARELGIGARFGLVLSADAFYAPIPQMPLYKTCRVLAIEMESDTLFLVGQYRGWRTGAIFASDGTVDEIKPEWGEEAYRRGEQHAIQIALDALSRLAQSD